VIVIKLKELMVDMCRFVSIGGSNGNLEDNENSMKMQEQNAVNSLVNMMDNNEESIEIIGKNEGGSKVMIKERSNQFICGMDRKEVF